MTGAGGASAPSFTILVPTYNQGHYLPDCLDSLLHQTDPDWEAVVVNDGSTDDTAAVADRYAARDGRIRVVHKANGGVASALNEGLRRARGAWICWLSSDDMFRPRKLESDRIAIAQHPECGFFFSSFQLLQQETGSLQDYHLWGPLPRPEFQLATLLYRNYVNGITICVSRQAWQEVGPFDEDLRYGQDYDMWLRLLARQRGAFVPGWNAVSRHHAAQGSAVFQEACYYDTAKAALGFLNRNPFPALFPGLDLGRREDAVRALDFALGIAEADDGFQYWLGPNAALLLRIVEWVHDDAAREPGLGESLRAVAQARIERLARRTEPARELFRWRLAALVLDDPALARAFAAHDAREAGLGKVFRLRALGGAEGIPLSDYLQRLQGVTLPDGPFRPGEIHDVVLMVDGPVWAEAGAGPLRPRLESICAFLARSGWSVLLVGQGAPRILHRAGLTALTSPRDLRSRLATIFPTRVQLGRSRSACPDDGAVFFDPDCRLDEAEIGPALMSILRHRIGYRQLPHARLPVTWRPKVAGTHRRQIVFVCRSLWGGGAEKVMFQLASALDPARYEPIVVHVFNTAATVPYPDHVMILSLQDLVAPPPAVAPAEPPPVEAGPEPEPAPPDPASEALGSIEEPTHASADGSERPSDRPAPPEATDPEIRPAPPRTRGRPLLRRAVGLASRLLGVGARPGRRDAAPAPARDGPGSAADQPPAEPLPLPVADAAPEPPVAPEPVAPVVEIQPPPPEPAPAPDPYTAAEHAIAGRWPWAEWLLDVFAHLRDDAVIIPVMEESVVCVGLASAVRHRPYIASLHAIQSLYSGMLYADPRRRAAEEWLIAQASRGAEATFFPSRGAAEDLIGHFDVDPADVSAMPNPIDPDAIARLAEAPMETALTVGQDGPLFVFVGRYSSEKKPDLFIEACALLRDRLGAGRFVLVGEGPMRPALEEMVARLGLQGHVQLLGAVANPYPYMRAARGLVLTSWFEAFGLVLAEALACGTPIVSVDCTGGPRDILGDGRYGLLVPPEDARGLAEAMARLATDDALHARLAAAGPDRARAFAIDKVLDAWETVLARVAVPSHPAT